MRPKSRLVQCPNCQADVEWSEKSTFRPFCSERCKLIDLGEWASEEHKIPGEPTWPEANSETDSYIH